MKSIDSKTPFIAVAESRIGGRKENQDTCAWQDTHHGFLLLVCDGMGGGPSGKFASQMAADVIVNSVLDSKSTSDRRDVLTRAIRKANAALIEAQTASPERRGMGTTVTALLINEYSAVVAHVGDSRVYQLRGTSKIFRTFDHSRVFELVKAKAMTEEEARLSGESNIITRALGPMEKVEPDIAELPYEKDDRFVLCTDGIWGAMPEKELIKIAGGTKSLSGAVESLTITVDELGRTHGNTHDNLTVAMLQTPFNSKLKQKMSTKVKYILYALAALCVCSLLGNIIQHHIINQYENTESVESATAAKSIVSASSRDSLVTRAELERILEEEREKYREQSKAQDNYYGNKVEELTQMLNAQDDKSAQASEAKADRVTAELALIQKINSLIDLVSEIGRSKSERDVSDNVDAAKKQFKVIKTEVAGMKITNDEFNKCSENDWVGNAIMKDLNNPKRKRHIEAIQEAIESLKQQIQKQSSKS